ncbi:hypothetical protein [Actinoplanes sp. NBRC 103695]|uniref:hypothetical protein n=1 Tax=Actinoplanes sp. NBRC 103695 TaxID=3032202 RepID=UPI00249F95DE|nr:hypothetical protein [Actinoplanes sp. NBRC 103695]GLZ00668.1 hypothetical protein Acsp02_79200 [Actinoplanes sp. NBRC 103695]
MTITAVEITTRPPAETTTRPAGRAPEPAGVVIVANVEALASTNVARCNDDNPYR